MRLRTLAARALVDAIAYGWRLAQFHVRRPLPRVQHVVPMRLARLLTRSFPVALTYPNPVAPGHRVTLDLDLCQNHALYIRERGRYDLGWLRTLASALLDADLFVDVGAHVGVYALTLAQAFPRARVVAVEPLPSNAARIRRAAAWTGLGNVTVRQAAMTAVLGRPWFYVCPLSDGNGSLVPLQEYRTGDVRRDARQYQRRHPDFVPTLQVPALALDDLVDRPAVVKIDVEGGELEALRSGPQSLRGGLVDVLLVEVQATTAEPARTLLDEWGFDGYVYGSRRPLRYGELCPARDRVVNVLFLRRGTAAHARVNFG